jgi:hypothetical protein
MCGARTCPTGQHPASTGLATSFGTFSGETLGPRRRRAAAATAAPSSTKASEARASSVRGHAELLGEGSRERGGRRCARGSENLAPADRRRGRTSCRSALDAAALGLAGTGAAGSATCECAGTSTASAGGLLGVSAARFGVVRAGLGVAFERDTVRLAGAVRPVALAAAAPFLATDSAPGNGVSPVSAAAEASPRVSASASGAESPAAAAEGSAASSVAAGEGSSGVEATASAAVATFAVVAASPVGADSPVVAVSAVGAASAVGSTAGSG